MGDLLVRVTFFHCTHDRSPAVPRVYLGFLAALQILWGVLSKRGIYPEGADSVLVNLERSLSLFYGLAIHTSAPF